MVPVFVKDGVQFKPKNPILKTNLPEEPSDEKEEIPIYLPEPVIELPLHEVEDPLNLLGSDDELEAEGTKKKKPMLT